MAKNITIKYEEGTITINPTQVQSISVPDDKTKGGVIVDKRNSWTCTHNEAEAAVKVLEDINDRL